jgi:dihydrofolate reductase
LNIVVTRQTDWVAPVGVLVCASVAAALQSAADAAAEWGDEVFIIGGGELYAQTLAAVDTVYQTMVPRQIEGDTFYPELPAAAFEVVQVEAGAGAVPFTWQVLKRRRV